MGFCFQHTYRGKSRILVMWNPAYFDLQIILSGDQLIHVAAVCKLWMNSPFFISFVYAYNMKNQRAVLWDQLRGLHDQCKGPWMALGDYNCILNIEDRSTSAKGKWKEAKPLQKLLLDVGLYDFKFVGEFFTWNNKRKGGERIYSKIDRVLVNAEWEDTFQEAQALFLPPNISDHSPAVVVLKEKRQKKIPFKFLMDGPSGFSLSS